MTSNTVNLTTTYNKNLNFNPGASGKFDLRARQTNKNVAPPGITDNDQNYNANFK